MYIFVGCHFCPWKDVVNSTYVQLALCVTSHIENLVSPLLTSKLRVSPHTQSCHFFRLLECPPDCHSVLISWCRKIKVQTEAKSRKKAIWPGEIAIHGIIMAYSVLYFWGWENGCRKAQPAVCDITVKRHIYHILNQLKRASHNYLMSNIILAQIKFRTICHASLTSEGWKGIWSTRP